MVSMKCKQCAEKDKEIERAEVHQDNFLIIQTILVTTVLWLVIFMILGAMGIL